MAYVVLIAEGTASDVLDTAWQAKSERLRTYAKTPGTLVLYDTNLAREFVRDAKSDVAGGKLIVFRCDEPHDIVDLSAEATS